MKSKFQKNRIGKDFYFFSFVSEKYNEKASVYRNEKIGFINV